MLTNIYYYNFYQPYILKPQYDGVNTKKSEKKSVQEKKSTLDVDEYSVYLNKSLKTDVVTYAKDVYTNVISLKNSSKNLTRDFSEYRAYADLFDESEYSDFIETLDGDLRNFKDDYNRAYSFAAYQKHSNRLVDYSNDLKQNVSYYAHELSNLGIFENDNGLLDYDQSKMQEYLPLTKKADLSESLDRSNLLFRTVHNITKDELSNPMAEHMNFKGLAYYYNYKYDKVKIDTFQLIKTGLLVDYSL